MTSLGAACALSVFGQSSFVDRAPASGLTAPLVYGNPEKNVYILETTGSGYGFLDLFFANYVDLDHAKTPKPGDSSECEWKGIPVVCDPRGLPRTLNVLYRNNGNGTFTDISKQAGILGPGGRYGLGVVTADFNNDSLIDIYVACDMTPSLFHRNLGDGRFRDITSQAGPALKADRPSRGLAAGGRTQRRDVTGGGSYCAQSDLALHFGLGAAKTADLEVRWPSGKVQKRPGIRPGRHKLVEGGDPTRLD